MKQILLNAVPTESYLNLRRWYSEIKCKEEFERLQSLRKKITTSGYSFEPFDKHKTIFIHIPKCAGVSVNQTLFGNLAGGHRSLTEYLDIFEAESIRNYFKFTIVRNPWDRLVSAYFFLKKGGFNKRDKNWFDDELGQYDNFEQFVTEWVNRENVLRYHHFRPQTDYMFDRYRKIFIDFVGFFENLEDDFEYIANQIGVSDRLPQKNAGEHKSYQDYYNEKTIEIVSKAYEDDINILGYNFDNSNISKLIKLRNETNSKIITRSNCKF